MEYYCVYIIRSVNGKHYIGQTNNLSDRLIRHNSHRNKYTKGKGPWDLIISYETASRSDAVRLESCLKKLKNPLKAIVYLKNLLDNSERGI
jgi:putative endonuclease